MAEAVVGAVDIGGTKVAIGVGEASGHILAQAEVATAALAGPEAAMDWVAEGLRRLAAATVGDLARLDAIGVGSPGPFLHGRLYHSPHLGAWEGFDVGSALAARLGRPVRWQNDASAAALGEWRYGAGRGANTLVYVTVSTGIGAGMVVRGVPLWGANGNAGEFGHLVVDPEGALCACGRRGCLETVASGTAIARRAAERAAASPHLGGLSAVTAEAVFAAWARGDPVAAAVVEEAASALGRGLSWLLDLFNPDRLVLGGGVMQAGPAFFDRIRAACERFALPSVWAAAEWRLAGPSAFTGLLGAMAVALQAETLEPGP